MAYHLVNAEKSFMMPDKCISKNGCKTLTDSNQRVKGDISDNNVFDVLVTCKDISAISAVPGFKQGIADEIDAFMMAFEEHGTLLYYLESSFNYHGPLFVKCPSAPSFITFGKPSSDKADSLPAA